MISKKTAVRTICSVFAALGTILVMSHSVYAKESNEGRLVGLAPDESVVSAAVVFVQSGPSLSKTDVSMLPKEHLPEGTSGAYYRVGLLATERYTDVIVDLIAIGPEEWKKVVMSRVFSGQDIAHDIGNDQALSFKFIKWVNGSTFELEAPQKKGSQHFRVKISRDGSLQIVR